MDVSATGPGVAAAVPQASVEAITGTVSAPDASSRSAVPDTQTSPAPVPGSSPKTLAPAIAKLFAGPSVPDPIRLDVSYRVQRDPNIIVTVFTDPKTGEEVAQFPPEILIHLSQFFDQPTGVTLDRNA